MFEDQIEEVSFNNSIPVISVDEENLIRKYVNPKYFQVDLMIDYLNQHEIINIEIFNECMVPQAMNSLNMTFLRVYKATPRSHFIKRIPIYFYDLNESVSGEMSDLFDGYYSAVSGECSLERTIKRNIWSDYEDSFDFEDLYQKIEKIIYKYKIPMQKVIKYLIQQVGTSSYYDVFDKWYRYINIVDNLSEDNVFPQNIYYALNIELEKNSETPIMYAPIKDRFGDYLAYKHEDEFIINGFFPKDQDGNYSFQWISIWADQYDDIQNKDTIRQSFIDSNKNNVLIKPELKSSIRIKLNPDTIVFVGDSEKEISKKGVEFGEPNECWKEIYSGPRKMKLDCSILAKKREAFGKTARDIAKAVGISLRTYQRIENNDVKPDALTLFRIMNYLNISSADELLAKRIISDPGYILFKSNIPLADILENQREEAL